MAAPKRPSLSSLTEKKGGAASAQAEAASDAAEAPPAAKGPADLKTMQVRVNRAGWVEMTRLAQDLDVPLEGLMVEAFNDVLRKHQKPPVVERRQPGK